MAKRATVTYNEHPPWLRPPYWISKNVNKFQLHENISNKFALRPYRNDRM